MKLFRFLSMAAALPVVIEASLGSRNKTGPPPTNYALALINSFDVIDVSGPIDPLFYLSMERKLNLHIIADTLKPHWMQPVNAAMNPNNSDFRLSINPTHTYSNPPKDIEVLIVPGGPGARRSNVTEVANYVRDVYPNLKYLISVCSGAGILAKSGVLDGRNATTNKAVWDEVVAFGPHVNWVAPARWVIDGNIWTASGVVSGFDLIFEFIEEFYGKDTAHYLQGLIEHNRVTDPCDDPFTDWHGVPHSGDCNLSRRT